MPSLTTIGFAASSNPMRSVAGPDGNQWVTLNATNKIARVTPGGTVDEFACPSGITGPIDICVLSGNIWYVGTGGIVKISTFSGTPTQTKYTSISGGYGCIGGPDGFLWVTTGVHFYKITPADGSLATTHDVAAGGDLRNICSDGTAAVYATNRKDATGAISRCTTSGTVTTTACSDSGAGPIGICYDPVSDRVYVVAQDLGKIYKVTTGGTQTFEASYTVNASSQIGHVCVGPDGRIYTAGYNASFKNLYSMASGGGSFTTEVALAAGSGIWGVSPGPEGSVYVCQYASSSSIARWSFVGVAKTGTGETGSGSDSSSVAIAPATPSASDTGSGADTGGAAGVVHGVGFLGGSTTLMNDTLTPESTGIALDSHAPDGGGTWARVGGTDDLKPIKINASGRAYASCNNSAGSFSNVYEHSATVADGVWEIGWVISGSGGESYLGARKGTDGGGYNVILLYLDNGFGGHAGRVELLKRVGGVVTSFGTYDIPGYPGGLAYQRLRLSCIGSAVGVYLLAGDGVTWNLILSATITDLTTGKTGLWLLSSGNHADLGANSELLVDYVSASGTSTLGVETGTGTDTAGTPGPSVTSKTGSETGTGDDQRALKAILDPSTGSPGGAPSYFISRQTVQSPDVQNPPCGFIECNSGKMIFGYDSGASHASTDAHIVIKTATSEAAANAGTFSSPTTVTANDATYYYGGVWFTKVAEGANAGRIWMAYVRATVAAPRHYNTQLKYSDDEGVTWSAAINVSPMFSGNGTYYGDLINAPIVEIPGTGGQEFIIGTYGWDPGNTGAWLRIIKTTDGGMTWSLYSTLAPYDSSYTLGEANIALVRLANGAYRYVAAYNKTPNSAVDQTTTQIMIRYSDDAGLTWSSEADCGLGLTWCGAPAIYQSTYDSAVYLLLRNGGASAYQTFYSRSTNYGAAGSFTTTVSVDTVGSMRYGQWGQLASGRLGLCYGTETSITTAGIYWRVLSLSPATAGQGQETATGADSSAVSVVIGATTKVASDTGTGTDARVLAVSVTKSASDFGTGFDSSGGGSSTVPTVTRIATPTSLYSTQFSTSTLQSAQFGSSTLVPADDHAVSTTI